jgi:hypothetical protein
MDNRSMQVTSYNHWDTLSDKDSVSLQVSTVGKCCTNTILADISTSTHHMEFAKKIVLGDF